MCILFVFVNPNPEPGGYKIVLASNRDELFARPSKPAHEWSNHHGIFGGQDMQPGKEGGTWLVMNKQGRIGVLLNVGQSAGEMAAVDPTSGRGFYATEWVTNKDKDMTEIFKIIKEKHGDRQQPFRLVVCDTNGEPKIGTLTYAGSKFNGFLEEHLSPGIHALGNNAPGVTWNKVLKGKENFESIIENFPSWDERKDLRNKLIDLLTSKEKHWPDTGISNQMKSTEFVMENLSSIFVEIPEFYGTRTHTVILVNSEDQVMFYEKTMEGDPYSQPMAWIENVLEFKLETKIAANTSQTSCL